MEVKSGQPLEFNIGSNEHRAMYGSVESLHCTPETSITPCVNYTEIKTKIKF